MENKEDIGLQLAALTTLRDLIEERLTEVRALAQEQMLAYNNQLGVKSLDVRLGSEAIASITVAERKQSWIVNDEDFISWVEANYPDEIVITKTVRESFKKHILENAQVIDNSAIVVSSKTGEVIDGLTPRPISKGIQLRFKKEGRTAVVRELVLGQGQLKLADLWDASINEPRELTAGEEG